MEKRGGIPCDYTQTAVLNRGDLTIMTFIDTLGWDVLYIAFEVSWILSV
jgi:hypothetical protein